MKIRKSNRADIPSIMEIISHAQSLLRSGGVDQWQDGYPTAEIIAADIAKSESYLLEDNGVILATAVISFAARLPITLLTGSG
jgi:hypothetical protein